MAKGGGRGKEGAGREEEKKRSDETPRLGWKQRRLRLPLSAGAQRKRGGPTHAAPPLTGGPGRPSGAREGRQEGSAAGVGAKWGLAGNARVFPLARGSFLSRYSSAPEEFGFAAASGAGRGWPFQGQRCGLAGGSWSARWCLGLLRCYRAFRSLCRGWRNPEG